MLLHLAWARSLSTWHAPRSADFCTCSGKVPGFKVLRLHVPVFKVLRLHSRCLRVSTGTTHVRTEGMPQACPGRSFYTSLAKCTSIRTLKALAMPLDRRLVEHLTKWYVQPKHFTNQLYANTHMQQSTKTLHLRSRRTRSCLPSQLVCACRTY